MINGDVKEFVDRIYSCQDTIFVFQGIKYWFQGYTIPDKGVHMEVFQYQPPCEEYVWEYDGKTITECQNAFLKAPIFGGKTFWNAESEIEWVDD
ncbi:MAG: hypothetical protein LKE53_11640 [Oscillospiraceae bacterium]|jgi:hypothetical protein|nr:hypothetical protein [Oscillospiraceae bacterium]